MRFLADMGVSVRTVVWLRDQGHDAVHLRDEGLQRLPDEGILAKAASEGRILLTMDLDFGYLLAVSHGTVPSVILFRLDDERPTNINRRLADALACCKDELASGAIVSVSETGIRARMLPL